MLQPGAPPESPRLNIKEACSCKNLVEICGLRTDFTVLNCTPLTELPSEGLAARLCPADPLGCISSRYQIKFISKLVLCSVIF